MKQQQRRSETAVAFDRLVGQRIRARRALLGVSQEKLGEALGLTFQQVQKYEKGVNRVAASRMVVITKALRVPPSYFYVGDGTATEPLALAMIQDEMLLRLALKFSAIKNTKLRRHVVDMATEMAKQGL